MIELKEQQDAVDVEKNWNPIFFNGNTINRDNVGTTAKLLVNKNAKGIIKDVDKEISDDVLTEEVRKHYTNATATRFVNRFKEKLHTVAITFDCQEDLQKCLNEGIVISYTHYNVERFIPKRRVIQCYNCFGYDHPAVWCKKTQKICKYCTKTHTTNSVCQVKEKPEEYKCINCEEPHMATDPKCKKYIEKLQYLNRFNDD